MNIPTEKTAKNITDNHHLLLINRSKLDITGIIEVISFDESNITLSTTQGSMIVEGRQLHIVNLSTDKGELTVEGNISGIIYLETPSADKGGFWSRVFR